jgi:DNA end-binding protein Ku
MLLETLRFADEVRTSAPFFASVDDIEPDEELLNLAQELIDRKSAPFDPRRFVDQYTQAVRELIDAHAKRKKPVSVGGEEALSGGAKVIDLVEALKRSVKRAERSGSKRSPGTAKKRKAS